MFLISTYIRCKLFVKFWFTQSNLLRMFTKVTLLYVVWILFFSDAHAQEFKTDKIYLKHVQATEIRRKQFQEKEKEKEQRRWNEGTAEYEELRERTESRRLKAETEEVEKKKQAFLEASAYSQAIQARIQEKQKIQEVLRQKDRERFNSYKKPSTDTQESP